MTTSPPTSTPSASATTTGYHRAPAWALTAAGALLVLAVTWVLASRGEVANWERTAFHAVNQAPSWLYGPLWLVMQLGNVAVAMSTALVALMVTRRWRPPVAVLIATGLSWQLAKYVKHVVGRGRPTALLTDVVLPGLDEAGLGFVSGHSAVAFSLATVLAPYVPRRWRWLPFVVATLVAVARVHVGVHLPLDVVGGTALGVGVGALVNLALGTPIDPDPPAPPPPPDPSILTQPVDIERSSAPSTSAGQRRGPPAHLRWRSPRPGWHPGGPHARGRWARAPGRGRRQLNGGPDDQSAVVRPTGQARPVPPRPQ